MPSASPTRFGPAMSSVARRSPFPSIFVSADLVESSRVQRPNFARDAFKNSRSCGILIIRKRGDGSEPGRGCGERAISLLTVRVLSGQGLGSNRLRGLEIRDGEVRKTCQNLPKTANLLGDSRPAPPLGEGQAE